MKKCTLCGNHLKKENSFCPVCLSDKETIKECVIRNISKIYGTISLFIYPWVCLSMIIDIKNLKTLKIFIMSDNFIWFLLILLSFINTIYNIFFKYEKMENLQLMYKSLKTKLGENNERKN